MREKKLHTFVQIWGVSEREGKNEVAIRVWRVYNNKSKVKIWLNIRMFSNFRVRFCIFLVSLLNKRGKRLLSVNIENALEKFFYFSLNLSLDLEDIISKAMDSDRETYVEKSLIFDVSVEILCVVRCFDEWNFTIELWPSQKVVHLRRIALFKKIYFKTKKVIKNLQFANF